MSRLKSSCAPSSVTIFSVLMGGSCFARSERRDAGDRAAQDQRMHVMRALVSVYDLEVHEMPRDPELVADAVAAQHVACDSGDVQALAAVVALHDRGDLDRGRAFVLHPAQSQTPLQAERDLRLHVRQLLLDQLVRGERLAELLAVQ